MCFTNTKTLILSNHKSQLRWLHERGLELAVLCSIETDGDKPSMYSTSGFAFGESGISG